MLRTGIFGDYGVLVCFLLVVGGITKRAQIPFSA